MSITDHWDLIQGTEEWRNARKGILTASKIEEIITPTLKIADNKTSRAYLYSIVAERSSGFKEQEFSSYDMQRGLVEEVYAKDLYSQNIAQSKDCGFITNDDLGFVIGFSPDGLIGEDGLIEIKSRYPKYQVQTILDQEVPSEYMPQIQAGLMVSGRAWCDFISYSNGMPMFVKRVYPDEQIIEAIKIAAVNFETKAQEMLADYKIKSKGLIKAERRDYSDTGITPSDNEIIIGV